MLSAFFLSEEGTTQPKGGDLLVMSTYALSTVPKLDGLATQVWFADNAATTESLGRSRQYANTFKS